MPALVLRRSVLLAGLSVFLVGTFARPGVAQQLSARSGPQTVALLELYTSEGCNSCPSAADVLVSSLAAKGLTLDRVVPLGLHVDYWDALGWPTASHRQSSPNVSVRLPHATALAPFTHPCWSCTGAPLHMGCSLPRYNVSTPRKPALI